MAAVHPRSTAVRPAEPHLASSLLDSAALSSCLDLLSLPQPDDIAPSTPEVLYTRYKSLDDALGPLLYSGRLVALSSETSSLRDELARTLLVDCLVSCEENTVAVVDTTGNFDVIGLYAQILGRLESAASESVVNEMGQQEKEYVAAGMLERVKIMRVFDFVGMREAVAELRAGLEGRGKDGGTLKDDAAVEAIVAMSEQAPPLQERTEVADSEDEDEDEDVDASGDEMLFDAELSTKDPELLPAVTDSPILPSDQQDSPRLRLKLVLIDNLAHVLNPLLKRDTVSANTLATTFLTTLSNLTRSYSLHTILLNPCTTPRPASPTHQTPTHTAQQQHSIPAPQQTYTPQPPPPPSIFSSNTAVPALMGLLGRYADAHVLLTMMPRRKMDARVYYADTGGRERGKRRGVEMMGVVEVIADRWGGRVGAWGMFAEKEKGKNVRGT